MPPKKKRQTIKSRPKPKPKRTIMRRTRRKYGRGFLEDLKDENTDAGYNERFYDLLPLRKKILHSAKKVFHRGNDYFQSSKLLSLKGYDVADYLHQKGHPHLARQVNRLSGYLEHKGYGY